MEHPTDADPASADPVADWFARRTFRWDDFDVDALVEAKDAEGLTVSVVLPARNEAPTIGKVVGAVMALAGTLVDEVVVIDGSSTDGTAAVAADHGARVHTDTGAFPDLGRALGKGDALWRSLSVTSGDIVVFIDTDIRNPSTRFVSGLLGPLLTDPSIDLVKAFYERPIELDGVVHPSGGGRVTELLARPLLNLLWPALSGLVQPLSGEYAGRRSLLEAVPFFTGYGVELGLLVDTLGLRGADAIAQVDLERRLHRNQSLEALSAMAYGILQAAVRRAPAGALPPPGPPPAYRQFERDGSGSVEMLDPVDVRVVERPPMATQR